MAIVMPTNLAYITSRPAYLHMLSIQDTSSHKLSFAIRAFPQLRYLTQWISLVWRHRSERCRSSLASENEVRDYLGTPYLYQRIRMYLVSPVSYLIGFPNPNCAIHVGLIMKSWLARCLFNGTYISSFTRHMHSSQGGVWFCLHFWVTWRWAGVDSRRSSENLCIIHHMRRSKYIPWCD